jgi:histidinol-phosphatase
MVVSLLKQASYISMRLNHAIALLPSVVAVQLSILHCQLSIAVMNLTPYLTLATHAAHEAGKLTLKYFQAPLTPDWKADASPVTVADRESEQVLRRIISSSYPDHAILGEEYGENNPSSPFRWIVDPIDGTRSFIHGVPLYSVLIGLEVEGELVVGVAYFPALKEMVAAAKGEGATWNGNVCRVTTTPRLSDALVCYTDERTFAPYGYEAQRQRLVSACGTLRGWSDSYAHILVATGRADAAVDPYMEAWDSAALAVIVREAGGTFTDWKGNNTIYNGEAISTNGTLRDEILTLVN